MARGFRIMLRGLTYQCHRCCRPSETWCSLPHRISSTCPLGHGILWIVFLRFHQSNCWCHLVRDSVLLRRQPDVYLFKMHIWAQVEQLGKPTASFSRCHFEATLVLLSGVDT